MKKTLLILTVLILGWQLTVFIANKSGDGPTQLKTTDSLQAKQPLPDDARIDSFKAGPNDVDTVLKQRLYLPGTVHTDGVSPEAVVQFAKTLIGVPYRYGAAHPENGFDCSGFITYVFKKFGVVVPRSSIDFTHVGEEVSAASAKPGDLILFTGTDSLEKFVGHMGIVVSNTDSLRFIHATSGKKYGVTITPLNRYYQGRYVKTVRVFP